MEHFCQVNKNREKPCREESEEEHGRDELECERFVKELPRDRHMIAPAYVRDKEMSQIDRGQGNCGRSKNVADLNRPYHRVTILLLQWSGQLHQGAPETDTPLWRHLHGSPFRVPSVTDLPINKESITLQTLQLDWCETESEEEEWFYIVWNVRRILSERKSDEEYGDEARGVAFAIQRSRETEWENRGRRRKSNLTSLRAGHHFLYDIIIIDSSFLFWINSE